MYTNMLRLASITLLATIASATTYANFCDDTACTVNCGESVSTDNPGCLAESGRQSVSFHDHNFQNVNLVSSPDSACSCQNYCYNDVVIGTGGTGPGCMGLTGPTANSYRFVGNQACDINNC